MRVLSAVEYVVQEYWLKTPFAEDQLYPRVGSTMFEALVIEGINATAHHRVMQNHLQSTSQWLLDFDLQSFAQDWDEYEQDNIAVQEEMKIIGVPDRQKQFLKDLIKRKRIYYKMTKWEEKARENIKRRLSLLGRSRR
jgi:predicted metal-dependent HD superfamily phosphohydrolase